MRLYHVVSVALVSACAFVFSSAALGASSHQAIAEARFMRLGGIQQWITIRGEDRSKPVLLYLHGGPGDAQSSLPSVYAPLEKDFVLVQWDQRGAGRTLGHLDPDTQPTSLPQLISDAVELAKYLQSYLHTDKVV